MADLPKRVALVYDWVVKWGGAERVLLALHELFPNAPLYTSVASANWAEVFPKVIPTFLQKLPGAATHHELFPWLTPLAFENLDFSDVDLVISVTSAHAKAIITSPKTLHICYCLTPTRYLWSHETEYKKGILKLISPVFNYLKYWDKIASARPDHYIAISKTVQARIKKYYNKNSLLVYPPVNLAPVSSALVPSDYYLWVGRFVSYKKPLEVIKAFNQSGLPLVMVGIGKELSAAKKLAKANITFMGYAPESKLAELYQHAIALIVFHEEDFGIVSLEAQSVGTPVIGFNSGGVSETVIDGITGVLDSDLSSAITRFQTLTFDSKAIIKNAQQYSKERFLLEFGKVVSKLWTQHQSTHTF